MYSQSNTYNSPRRWRVAIPVKTKEYSTINIITALFNTTVTHVHFRSS